MRRLGLVAVMLGAFSVATGAARGEVVELVFSGHIDRVNDYGTLGQPFASWRVGEPYELKIILDSRPRGSEFEGRWAVYSMSIEAAGEVHQAPVTQYMGLWSYSEPDRVWVFWEAYLTDRWESGVFIEGQAELPGGTLSGLAPLDCELAERLFSPMVFSGAGVVRPDDESAVGPFQLTACHTVPCDPRYCPVDFNCDGGVDGADVEAFFGAWEAGAEAADADHNGGVDGSDVEVFFTLWERGEC